MNETPYVDEKLDKKIKELCDELELIYIGAEIDPTPRYVVPISPIGSIGDTLRKLKEIEGDKIKFVSIVCRFVEHPTKGYWINDIVRVHVRSIVPIDYFIYL